MQKQTKQTGSIVTNSGQHLKRFVKKGGEKRELSTHHVSTASAFLYSDPTCISVHPTHKIFAKARKYPSRGLY